MKMNKLTRYIAAFSALSVLLISCGRVKKDEERKEDGQQQVLSHDIEEETPEFTIYYEVKLSGDSIILCEIDSMGEKPLEALTIDKNYYPTEDIQALEQGIRSYTKEGAYEILENFTN